MPAFSPISLEDAQPTPVAHVFAPEALSSKDGKNIAVFVDRSSGVIVGYWRLRSEFSPRNSNGMIKVRYVIERVTLETLSNNTASGVNPAPKKAYTTTANLEFWVHERSTLQERKDIRTLLYFLTLNGGFQASIDNLETWY